MEQPPVSRPGRGEQPGRDSGLPGGGSAPSNAPSAGRRERMLQLGDFMTGGAGDTCPPGPRLAEALDRVSGPDRRCSWATDNELTGILAQWAALESWAAAGKLGVLAELLRRRALGGHDKRAGGDLPDAWEDDTSHEVMPALGLSAPGADKLLDLAWTLGARLPGIYAKLADGTIDFVKARIIAGELRVLNDEAAAQAEALILGELDGKTPGMIGRLAAQAACTVDPAGAAKRREHAEREDARVRFWRENGGACALAAYGLPTDAALAANANIKTRARQYKQARICPDATMDQLRALAYVDILNGLTAEARITAARAGQPQPSPQDDAPRGNSPKAGQGEGGDDSPGDDGGDGPGGGEGLGGTGSVRKGGESGAVSGSSATGSGDAGPEFAASINLTIPLGTYLGQADRPGHSHGLGPIDPKLARDLAAAAARNPHSRWCVTVTDADGIAIGHGCAKPNRKQRAKQPGGCGARDGPAFTPRDAPGPPGGYDAWTLTLPGGRELEVSLTPIPVTDCDHRYETNGYEPSDLLRHLVQIRDGECTFPCCSRHARECDFEHAVPHDKGGRTCACNAGARSRRCHKVKQSKGWSVERPLPGWHQWTTPSGRTYTQGPAKYPI